VLAGMSSSIPLMEDVAFAIEVTRSFLQAAGSSAEDLYRFFFERGFTGSSGLQDRDQWDEIFTRQ
jgi:hypothetical protein